MRSRFKDFIICGTRNVSDDVNNWLEQNPYVKIVRWSAAPISDYCIRLIIEFEDLSSSAYASTTVARGSTEYLQHNDEKE